VIGALLIDHLLNVAQYNRITYLHVPSTHNAIPFYEKMGFIKDDLQPNMADEITWMILKLKIKESSH
jgi:ribosomal protein S18 acetylase RimI-like enzyme